MLRLIKADLFKTIKSKLSLIVLIIAVVFPILIVFLYLGINALFEAGLEGDMGFDLFSAKTIMGSTYSLSNNVGIVLPIFAAILVGLDMSNGTLRNKIIAGHSREKVYFSHLIVSIIFNVVIITIYALVTVGFSLIFFKYGKEINKEEILNIIYFYILGTFTYIFVATLSTFLSLNLKSNALAIIIMVVINLLMAIVATLVNFLDYENYKYAIYLIPTFVLNQFAANIDLKMFICGMVSYIGLGALNTVAGVLLFKYKDLK